MVGVGKSLSQCLGLFMSSYSAPRRQPLASYDPSPNRTANTTMARLPSDQTITLTSSSTVSKKEAGAFTVKLSFSSYFYSNSCVSPYYCGLLTCDFTEFTNKKQQACPLKVP